MGHVLMRLWCGSRDRLGLPGRKASSETGPHRPLGHAEEAGPEAGAVERRQAGVPGTQRPRQPRSVSPSAFNADSLHPDRSRNPTDRRKGKEKPSKLATMSIYRALVKCQLLFQTLYI